ncbi:hypothetical protein [Longitalea luteola]|uniref:hypothetical protein n=1 Tax=Longitalea luteola TaxID=2812563 RepID=UPI001A960141|nr:hypothetical protein [Longitalea luteola]
MGKFEPPFSFTGTVSNISVYKVRGSDKPVVRMKGGPTKRQIETRASFATTRKNNKEFGGRARIAGQVLEALRPLKYLGDFNLAGPLNSLFIPIQALDTEHPHGERNVELSKAPGLLQGFNLNRRTPFETIVANQLDYTLSKETVKASITFPALMPGINFFPPGKYSWYRFIAVLATVEDMFYSNGEYQPEHGANREMNMYTIEETDWMAVTPRSEPFTMELNKLGTYYERAADRKQFNRHSLLLAAGIAFGNMPKGQIQMVKYVGGAKILAMA